MTHWHAAQPAAAGTPDDRATEFKAVDPNAEHYSGGTLLVEAYAAIWLILMAWLLLLWRKQRSLTQRLDGLEAAIDRAAAAKDAKEQREAGASSPAR